jgi:glyoxylase-like metal-dependent hydrolase (beta-lactamase superfamily II)
LIKKLGLIILLSVASFAMDYKLNPKKISNSVYMFTGHNEIVTSANGGNIANTYWVNTGKHWVVIDSGASYLYAKQAHEQMKKIANLPIKLVIDTHMHDDHWMGNSYYKELNIPLYAVKLQSDTFKVGGSTRILHKLKAKDAIGTKIVKIDNVILKNTTVNVDGYKFEIIVLEKPAHTKQDMFVYMPKEKVLFSGDLLFSQRLTSIRDGSIEGSLKSLDIMGKYDVKVWANGHGKFTDLTAYNHMKSYLGDLKRLALQAVEDEVELDTFVKTADMSKYKDMKLFDRLSKANLDNAFREYEFFEEE